MRTVDPQTCVAFKQWMAEQAQNREPVKRRRDLYQAKIVQELMDKGLRVSRASGIVTRCASGVWLNGKLESDPNYPQLPLVRSLRA